MHEALTRLIDGDWERDDDIPLNIAEPIVRAAQEGNSGYPNTIFSVRHRNKCWRVKCEHRFHQARYWGYHCCTPEEMQDVDLDGSLFSSKGKPCGA